MPRRRRRSIFFYIWINQLKQRSRVFGEGGAVWSSVLAIALGKVATKKKKTEERIERGIGKNIIRARGFALPVNIFSAFGFLMVNIQLFSGSFSQKGYQRLAAFFSDHPKILWRSTGEREDIFPKRRFGCLQSCTSIETAFRHKFIR